MENILDGLLCSDCNKYMSVLPIKVYPNRSIKCGRCNFEGYGGTVSKLYEMLAEKIIFPCVNLYEGCTANLPPSKMKQHELVCIGTYVKCPICLKSHGNSLVVVEHFKKEHPTRLLRHPELLINFNERNEDLFYLYANYTAKISGIIYVRYDHLVKQLYINIAPIYLASFSKKIYLETIELSTIHRKVMYRSSEKKCARYLSNNWYGPSNEKSLSIKENYPGNIGICNFFIQEETSNFIELMGWNFQPEIRIVIEENIKHVPCTEPHFPAKHIKLIESCKRQHVDENPVMLISSTEKSTHRFKFFIGNVRTLTSTFTPIFYLGNTTWKILVQKKQKGNIPYLACWVDKVDDPHQNKFSYKIDFSISVLSTDATKNITKSAKERIYGKRSNESMGWGFGEFVSWGILFEPNKKLIHFESKVQIEVFMTLIKVFPHKRSCQCGCKS